MPKSFIGPKNQLPKQSHHVDFRFNRANWYENTKQGKKFAKKDKYGEHFYEQRINELAYSDATLLSSRISQSSKRRIEHTYSSLFNNPTHEEIKATNGHLFFVKKTKDNLEKFFQFELPKRDEKDLTAVLDEYELVEKAYTYKLTNPDWLKEIYNDPGFPTHTSTHQKLSFVVNECKKKEANPPPIAAPLP
jgi:hypothetical protein